MRTTLTLDDDVAALLEKENRRAQEPMKQTVNRMLRTALFQASKPQPRKRFVVKSFDLGPVPEKWRGLTPSQIDTEMEYESYLEKRDRPGH